LLLFFQAKLQLQIQAQREMEKRQKEKEKEMGLAKKTEGSLTGKLYLTNVLNKTKHTCKITEGSLAGN